MRKGGSTKHGEVRLYLLLALLIFAPLPAASVYEWSILVIELWVLAITAYYVLTSRRFGGEGSARDSFVKTGVAGKLFVALFAFIALQMVPLPAFVVEIISPQTYEMKSLLIGTEKETSFLALALSPSTSLRVALEFLAYFLFGFLLVQTVKRKKQIYAAVGVLVGIGIFEAAFGLVQLTTDNPSLLLYKKKYGLDVVTGTFVNRNHLSGFLEMIIPLAIGLVIARIDFFSLERLNWRARLLKLAEKGMTVNLMLTLGIVLMTIAVIFSESRSGVFVVILTFLLFFELSVLFGRGTRKRKRDVRRFVGLVFLVITVMVLYIGIDSIIARFEMLSGDMSRYQYWENTMDMIGDFPLTGIGLGNFLYVYPKYETHWGSARLSHTHNDYLEYLSELGGIGFALLAGGVLYLMIKSFLIWRRRRHPEVKGLAMGGIIALINMLFHSITDFNLQIPANKLLFAAVLALTWVTVHYKYGESGAGSPVRMKIYKGPTPSRLKKQEPRPNQIRRRPL